MNGAAAVDDSSIRAAKSRNTTRIGVSHHFLLCRRKYHSSRRKLPSASFAAFSKSLMVPLDLSILPEVAGGFAGHRLRRPAARLAGRPRESQVVTAAQFEQPCHRQHHTEEH